MCQTTLCDLEETNLKIVLLMGKSLLTLELSTEVELIDIAERVGRITIDEFKVYL